MVTDANHIHQVFEFGNRFFNVRGALGPVHMDEQPGKRNRRQRARSTISLVLLTAPPRSVDGATVRAITGLVRPLASGSARPTLVIDQ